MKKNRFFWPVTLDDPLNEFKYGRTSTKDDVIVFWDAQGIILIDYLQKGQTNTEKCYATLPSRLHEKLRTERSKLAYRKILFHQDNAPAHTSVVSMAKVHELRFKLLPRPPYSLDLAPSDFFLFPNLKISLEGNRFSFGEDVIASVDEYFKGFLIFCFSKGIKKLEERWTKSVQVRLCWKIKEKEIMLKNKKEFFIKKAFLYIFVAVYFVYSCRKLQHKCTVIFNGESWINIARVEFLLDDDEIVLDNDTISQGYETGGDETRDSENLIVDQAEEDYMTDHISEKRGWVSELTRRLGLLRKPC